MAGLLAGVGGLALARTTSPQRRMFSAIPLLFAAQQAAEGVVWRTVADGGALHSAAVFAFLSIALVVWPLWLPLSLRRVESDPSRRLLLAGASLAGALVAAYAAYLLLRWPPVAQVAGHSIHYHYGTHPGLASSLLYLATYAIPTVVPFFLSSGRMARTIGFVLVVSLAVAVVVQRSALTSVWCFFAAVLSGLVFLAVRSEESRQGPGPGGGGRPSSPESE